MATNILKLPISRVVCRGLSSQPSLKPEACYEGPPIECTVLPNKILVSSQDQIGGLSRISVVFRTGPRNEMPKYAGATHVIRSMAGMSTQNFTDFFILRNIQQSGSHFTCTGDREFTSFNLVGLRNQMMQVAPFLASVVSGPEFKPWQIKRNLPRLKYEMSLLSPQAQVMELLHKVAYRHGLGNSLFVPESVLGSHTTELLKEYYFSGFSEKRTAVIGINVTHKDAVKFAESFTLSDNEPPTGNSEYFGGEIRQETPSYFATVALATKGVGLKDLKDSLTFGILQHAMGVSPSTKWGSSPSPLFKALQEQAPQAGGKCMNICYSDSGLFGIIVTSPAINACRAVKAIWSVLKNGEVSDADVNRGKAMLKTNILLNCENSENLADDIAVQSLVNGAVVPGPVLAQAVEKITVSEVKAAAKKVAAGPFSLVAHGNLSDVPYLSDLK